MKMAMKENDFSVQSSSEKCAETILEEINVPRW